MHALTFLGALMGTALVLPAGAASHRTFNTTCDPGKTVHASVAASALPSARTSSVVNVENLAPTIVTVPGISTPVCESAAISTTSTVGDSSEDMTTIIMKKKLTKTITRSFKRVPASDALSSPLIGRTSVAIPELTSVPTTSVSEETAIGVLVSTTMTLAAPQSGSTIEEHSATSMVDLGSDSIVTISESLGSGSLVEWTKTVALTPSLPDLIEPSSGDFTVSFGASTISFVTLETPGVPSSSSGSLPISSTSTSESSADWETVWEGRPGPVETSLSLPPAIISTVPANTDTVILNTSVEPTSTAVNDVSPSVVVPSTTLITIPYSFPAYLPSEPLPTTSETATSPLSSQTPEIVIFTIPGDDIGQSRVITLTTKLPAVDGTPWLATSAFKSATEVVFTYTMPGGYGHSPSVVTLATSKPVSTISRIKSSTSVSRSKSGATSVVESITVVTYGPWPSPPFSSRKTTTSSSKHLLSTSVSFSIGGSSHPSNHGAGATPFVNSTLAGSMSSTTLPSGSVIQASAATSFPKPSNSRDTPTSTGASASLPITSSKVTSRSLASSTVRATSVGSSITSGEVFTSAVGVPFRPSRGPRTTPSFSGTVNMTETSPFMGPTATTQLAQSSVNATGSVSANSTTGSLSGGEVSTTRSFNTGAGQSEITNSTASSIPSPTTQPGETDQGGFNITSGSSSATSSIQIPQGQTDLTATFRTSSVIRSGSSAFPVNSTRASGTGISASARPSLTQGNPGATHPLVTTSPATPVQAVGGNSTSASGTAASTITRGGQTQRGPSNSLTSSISKATTAPGAPQQQNDTSTAGTPAASSTPREQTQARSRISTLLPASLGTAAGSVQSQNTTFSTSAFVNSTSSAGATILKPSTTASSFQGQGQGGLETSAAAFSNITLPHVSTTISQTGDLPSQSQGLPAPTNSSSGVNASSSPTASRVGQTVGLQSPTRSLNGTAAANSTVASVSSLVASSSTPSRQSQGVSGAGPAMTNNSTTISTSTPAGQRGSPSSEVNSSDSSESPSGPPVQTQSGDLPASTALNDTTSITSSSARRPQSQGAAATLPTATWPPMTTQSINITGTNLTSTSADTSSAARPLSEDNSLSPTTTFTRGQEGQSGQPTQTAIGNPPGNVTLVTQGNNSTSSASSVNQIPQAQTTLATVVNPDANSTTALPATGTGSPLFCGNYWDRGNETITFDDRASLQWANATTAMPLFVPYHRLYFSEGFSIVPPPNQTHNPSSGNNMTMWLPPNSSVPVVGQIGFGPLRENSCFRFNPLSFNLGCNTTETICRFNVSGLRYDNIRDQEQQVSQFEVSFPSCRANNFTNCSLTTVDLGRYNLSDLTSITFDNIGNISRAWFGDDFAFAWTNDTCEAGRCRALVPNLSNQIRTTRFRSPRRFLLDHEASKEETAPFLSLPNWFRKAVGTD